MGQFFTLGLWEWLYIDGVLAFFWGGNCMDIESKNGTEGREGLGMGKGERVLSVFWSSGLLLTR